ncbi:S41 family peptidase [Tenacibaculum halocynthiae]|uniref:S41 family peptidase n=1 Tax=Tenacibaculum halocynthiae TaxID=1254437 RepID=UPI003D6621E6
MKKITYILQIFIVLISFSTLQSCREDSLEIAELNRTAVNSYSDLFNAFWDTMNNDYNYFNEQEENWDDIYRKYSPKFKAFSTFNKANVDPILAEKEANLAFKYFAEIITNKILDQHFGLSVVIPIPSVKSLNRQTTMTESFVSNMTYKYTEEDGFVNLGRTQRNPRVSQRDVRRVMGLQKLDPASIYVGGPLLAGFLKSDPETMYIQLSQFNVISHAINDGAFPILKDINSLSGINQSYFKALKDLDNTSGSQFENMMNDNLSELKKLVSTVIASNEYKNYTTALDKFKSTELVDDLEASLTPLANFTTTAKASFDTKNDAVLPLLRAYYNNPSTTAGQKAAVNELYGIYVKRIKSYQTISSFIFSTTLWGIFPITNDFDDVLSSIARNYSFDLYKKVYNPIANGKVKKVVLDLRSNGGGAVIDARIFTERFVTQQKVWGYQRTKEGNGRFNYSPWVPVETNPHQFGIKQNVPTAILIDESSVSMSEISTMMIKSQGNHVTIVGDNSAGGTAGLGGQDTFNGGNRLNNGYLSFYMPLMAFQDSNGKIVEAVGVTPDVKVIPTQTQVDQLSTTFIDPAYNAALNAIK